MTYPLLTIAIIVLLCLIVLGYIIKRSIKADKRDIYNNKRTILYNRRTKKIKEIYEKDYIESPTWKKVVTTHGSMFNNFMKYLQKKRIMSEGDNPVYLGDSPADGVFWLKHEFKKFLYESS